MPNLNAFTLTRAGASAGLSPFGPPPAWNDRARCAQPDVDPELFFAGDNERPQVRDRRVLAARAVCAQCPVRAECLTYAVDTRQHDGVWGGTSESHRRRLIALKTVKGATP